MATLSKKQNGTFEIQFKDGRQRKTIFLGKHFAERTASELHEAVERLLDSRNNSTPLDKRTAYWIETASAEIQEKLVNVGLIDRPARHTARELWDAFLKTKTDIKPTTMETYETAQERFFEFFKEGDLISSLTKDQMSDWRDSLRENFAKATTAGTLAKVKAVFNWAVAKGWLVKSPLDGVGRGSFVNREKDRFITMEEYRLLLEVCPCQDWRAILALARIGGLRAPSEVLRLRWSDIDWDRNRFYVRSPKTEHHEGKGGRTVPLFPKLREELERSLKSKPEDAEYVITRYQDRERTNLGTQFARIVLMAGIDSIEKPFTNMRASRSTEVYAEFGAFYESVWIGHSPKIARDHYLQVRDEDFDKATRPEPKDNDD